MLKKKKKHTPELVVVGAGPVGLTAALRAVREGLKVEIFDTAMRTGMHSYGLAIHPNTLDLLEDLGLAQELIAEGNRINTIVLHDAREVLAEIPLKDLECQSSFVLVARQSYLERRLEQKLRDQGVRVAWNHHVRPVKGEPESSDLVPLEIDALERVSSGYAVPESEWVVERTLAYDTPFVIGADGHRSTVRQYLDIDYRRLAEPSVYAVFEFKSNLSETDQMHIVLRDDSTSVLWPLPGGYCRWSFQIPEAGIRLEPREKDRILLGADVGEFPQISDESLDRYIEERAPWFKGAHDEVNWRMVVRFERRLAERFGEGRYWLAGDAAHLTSPVGVQSMNIGMREATTLVERLAPSIKGKESGAALASYNDERLVEWQQLLNLQDRYAAEDSAPQWVKKNTGRLVSSMPVSGAHLEAVLRRIGISRVAMNRQ